MSVPFGCLLELIVVTGWLGVTRLQVVLDTLRYLHQLRVGLGASVRARLQNPDGWAAPRSERQHVVPPTT